VNPELPRTRFRAFPPVKSRVTSLLFAGVFGGARTSPRFFRLLRPMGGIMFHADMKSHFIDTIAYVLLPEAY